MNQSELIHAIDTLYHRTYVPITLLDDEAGSLVFPRYAPIMSLKENLNIYLLMMNSLYISSTPMKCWVLPFYIPVIKNVIVF